MVARKKSNEAAPAEAEKAEDNSNRRQITIAQFRPDKEWTQKHLSVVGTRLAIARIYGIVMKVDRRPIQLADGSPSETVVCVGAFRCENYATGDKGASRNAVFPAGYATSLEAAFKAGNPFEVDVDIYIEATAKGTAWIVVPLIEGDNLNYLDGLEASRDRPENAAPLTSAGEPVQSAADQEAAPSAA